MVTSLIHNLDSTDYYHCVLCITIMIYDILFILALIIITLE